MQKGSWAGGIEFGEAANWNVWHQMTAVICFLWINVVEVNFA